jgi:hypothetical protein
MGVRFGLLSDLVLDTTSGVQRRSLSLDGRVATVDEDDLAANEIRGSRSQEQDRVRDLNRLPEPPRRDLGLHRLSFLRGTPGLPAHLGEDHRRRHGARALVVLIRLRPAPR